MRDFSAAPLQAVNKVKKRVFEFSKLNIFQKKILTIIANIASKRDNEELRELRRVFREIDRNRDGAITLDELSDGMNHLVKLMQAEVTTIEDLFH